MKFGVFINASEITMDVGDLAEALEERGFESIWLPEHTHIPSSRLTRPPVGRGDLPEEYKHSLDPWVGLAVAAMRTTRLRLGTGVALVMERDPIALAKSVASLDQLSGGRVEFGVGGGWNREEMENHGTPFDRRFRILRERTEAMQAIWTQEEASYRGETVRFERIWSWPKPVQKPHPPIIMGGDGPHTLKRVVRYADEWMPIQQTLGSLSDKVSRLNALAAEAGRGPIPVGLFFATRKPRELAEFQAAGVKRCVFYLPPLMRDGLLPKLDALVPLVEQFA
jgi:probable F420-dependent oxidoreductase